MQVVDCLDHLCEVGHRFPHSHEYDMGGIRGNTPQVDELFDYLEGL
jgi:hypothetical protein